MTDDEQKERDQYTGWRMWPPSPKTQIWTIVGICVLINVILIAVWVIALLYTR